MNRNIRRAALALALTGMLALSGCSGKNDVAQEGISVVRGETGAQYTLTTVRTGDITLTESVRVKYFAANQSNQGFSESGLYYDSFHVSVGDEVKAGDMLATLDCAALDIQIAEKQAALEELGLSYERNAQLLALFDQRQGEKPLSADDNAARREYETAIRDAEGEIAIVSTELDQLLSQREGRIIYADIDGTVTYVRDAEPGETSVSGRVVVTVTDLDSCAFTATVEHPGALDPEEIYAAKIDGAFYDIQLTTAEALGVEEEPMNAQSKLTRVYFRPVVPSVELEADASGTFTVVVDSSENTNYIPLAALTEVSGAPSVYVPDENGLMQARGVEVGLTTSRYAEILSGLEAGDSVIMY